MKATMTATARRNRTRRSILPAILRPIWSRRQPAAANASRPSEIDDRKIQAFKTQTFKTQAFKTQAFKTQAFNTQAFKPKPLGKSDMPTPPHTQTA